MEHKTYIKRFKTDNRFGHDVTSVLKAEVDIVDNETYCFVFYGSYNANLNSLVENKPLYNTRFEQMYLDTKTLKAIFDWATSKGWKNEQ